MTTNQTNTARYKEIEATLLINKMAQNSYAPRSSETKIEVIYNVISHM